MKKILLTFATEAGNKVSLSVPEPKDNLTEAEVLAAMQAVVTADVFRPKGLSLVGPVTAKIVDTNTTVLTEI